MLIGTNRPTLMESATVPSDGNATMITDDQALVDGSPGLPTRFQYDGSGNIDILLDFIAEPIVPRIACLLGVTLATGTVVELAGREAGDVDFTTALGEGGTASATVRELPGGSRCVWWILADSLGDFDGYRIRILSPSLTAGEFFDIGEFAVWEGQTVCAKSGTVNYAMLNATPDDRSLSGQSWPDYQLPYRQFSCSLSPRPDGGTWGVIDELAHAMARGEKVAIVPQWRNAEGAFDEDLLVRMAVFGVASEVPGAAHVTRRVWGNERIVVREVPAKPFYVVDDTPSSSSS